VTLPDFGYPV